MTINLSNHYYISGHFIVDQDYSPGNSLVTRTQDYRKYTIPTDTRGKVFPRDLCGKVFPTDLFGKVFPINLCGKGFP